MYFLIIHTQLLLVVSTAIVPEPKRTIFGIVTFYSVRFKWSYVKQEEDNPSLPYKLIQKSFVKVSKNVVKLFDIF